MSTQFWPSDASSSYYLSRVTIRVPLRVRRLTPLAQDRSSVLGRGGFWRSGGGRWRADDQPLRGTLLSAATCVSHTLLDISPSTSVGDWGLHLVCLLSSKYRALHATANVCCHDYSINICRNGVSMPRMPLSPCLSIDSPVGFVISVPRNHRDDCAQLWLVCG